MAGRAWIGRGAGDVEFMTRKPPGRAPLTYMARRGPVRGNGKPGG